MKVESNYKSILLKSMKITPELINSLKTDIDKLSDKI